MQNSFLVHFNLKFIEIKFIMFTSEFKQKRFENEKNKAEKKHTNK